MRGGGGYDRRQVRRKFLRGRPLIEPSVRTAPHRHFAVAKRLLRQPLDDIMSVARLICERLELAAGIAATANIDKCKHVPVRREVCSAGVIGVGNVGCECENDGRSWGYS